MEPDVETDVVEETRRVLQGLDARETSLITLLQKIQGAFGYLPREAMLELALCYGSGEPVRIRTIADTHGVSPRFLVQILLQDPEPLMDHGEIVWRNGKPVGEVRAASYGHTLGGAVGLAFVHGDPADKAFIESGEWEVEVGARRYPATVSLRPMYDPAMQRVRA